MVRAARVTLGLALGAAFVSSAACSSSTRDPNEFGEEGSSSGELSSSGGITPPGASSGSTIGGSSGGGGSSSGFAECASQSANASLSPVYLTIVLDKSGSMCFHGQGEDQECDNSSSRWKQVQSALNTFFQSPESAGVFVSVIPFAGGYCSANDYDSVPNGYPHRLALPVDDDVSLGGDPSGGTPTAPALEGGLDFTKDEADSDLPDNAKVAILFTTDGVPDGCYDNNGDPISRTGGTSAAELEPSLDAANAAVAAGVPLYVLGIGGNTEFDILDQIAAVAGTNGGSAFKIDAGNPGDVGGQMLAALAAIRGEQLSCELPLPAPPEGEALDFNKINVVYTPAGGEDVVLPRSDDCADNNGWHYDDPSAPTSIQLCDGACETAKGSGELKIVLGCATQGPS